MNYAKLKKSELVALLEERDARIAELEASVSSSATHTAPVDPELASYEQLANIGSGLSAQPTRPDGTVVRIFSKRDGTRWEKVKVGYNRYTERRIG